MAISRRYDNEELARIEFLAYLILVFAITGIATGMYFFYSWLSA